MARIRGLEGNLRRLKGLSTDQIAPDIGRALFATAQEIAADAQISITTGAVSGASHIPSPAGTPPNNDTGGLANNIEAELIGPFEAQVSSNAEYAAIQEFGGTINHPGGTPYFIGRDGKAVFVSKQGQGAFHHLPVTKPHTITLPERPYMRPAALRGEKILTRNIAAAVKKIVGRITK